jgi:hypothetical protein
MSIGQPADDALSDGTTMPSDLETIFAGARQGAANVAGVRFQILVTGWLLVMGDRLPIPISSVLPEGLEDVDCQTADGRRVLVQVKERRGGDTTWPIGEMVAAVEHAEPALGATVDATLIVVTNARPGRGLAACRLDQTLRDVLDDPTALTVALEAASLDPDLHGRAALTTLSGPVIHEEAIAAVTADHHVAPAIAALIWARLLEEMYSIAAGQRGSTPATAARADRSTVDTLAEQVQGTVNPDALQEPVRRGLIGTLDFSMPLDVALERFLLGVDVRPGHIAAGLDLLRPAEMQAVVASAAPEPYFAGRPARASQRCCGAAPTSSPDRTVRSNCDASLTTTSRRSSAGCGCCARPPRRPFWSAPTIWVGRGPLAGPNSCVA